MTRKQDYRRAFVANVFELLGGLDMAREFFAMHPEQVPRMHKHLRYHRRKGGAAWKGARIYFQFDAKPALDSDRLEACRRPIPALDPDTDIRR